MKWKLLLTLALAAFLPMLLLRQNTEMAEQVVIPQKTPVSLDSSIASPEPSIDLGYRVLVYQQDSKSLPSPILVQEQPEQAQSVSPADQVEEDGYAWDYYWWWIIIGGIFISCIIIFAAWGGWGSRGHGEPPPPESHL